MCFSVSSSASTLNATIVARPRAWHPSAPAVAQSMWRGLFEKNTNPTMSAPASSAASSVGAVERPQILTVGVIGRFFRSKRPRCQRLPNALMPQRTREAGVSKDDPAGADFAETGVVLRPLRGGSGRDLRGRSLFHLPRAQV